MSLLDADNFVSHAVSLGLGPFVGVPCSTLGPVITAASGLGYIAATNEGDAVAFAGGAALAGRLPVVLMQNSGLGNATNPLASLHQIAHLPAVLLVSWRGEPDAGADEPQHALMGAITPQLLALLRVPAEVLPTEAEAAQAALARMTALARASDRPVALIVRKKTFAERARAANPADTLPSRRDYLAAAKGAAGPRDVLIATTGYTGRELEALGDAKNQLYVVGAMGCASSLGLGIAVSTPRARVIVLDGDGAALMRLSALPAIGALCPNNLLHVVLDNQRYDSTGGQESVAATVDFVATARACGYRRAVSLTSPAALSALIQDDAAVLTLAHAPIAPHGPSPATRPGTGPLDVARRLRQFLKELP